MPAIRPEEISAVIQKEIRSRPVRPHERLVGAPPVLLERLALPGVDGDASRVLRRAVRTDDDRRGGVVLG